jgi:hypothetical protein
MKAPTPPDSETGPFDAEPDEPPSEEELRAAVALREALADSTLENDDAFVARALVLGHSPRPLDDTENRSLVVRALAVPPVQTTIVSLNAARAHKRRSAWLAAGVAALAVAATVLVYQVKSHDDVSSASPIHRSRSTQALFHQAFAVRGGESARIDRIASARAVDLRENMFTRWSVP